MTYLFKYLSPPNVRIKKLIIAYIILVGMFFAVSAGCIEITSQTRSTETIFGDIEVTEHTHLWPEFVNF